MNEIKIDYILYSNDSKCKVLKRKLDDLKSITRSSTTLSLWKALGFKVFRCLGV